MKFYEFLGEFRKLNPNVDILVGDPAYSSDAFNTIYINTKKKITLVLPKGFEYNEKNGITSKHKDGIGSYFNIQVKHNSENIYPLSPQKTHNQIMKESEKLDENADWDFYSFLYEFKRLNPWLNLNAQHPKYSPNATKEIFFTPDPSIMDREVIAPQGFEYDKNTKTYSNKHNTAGAYCDIKIQNTSKLNEDISSTFMTNEQLEKYYANSEKIRPIYSNKIPDISQSTDKYALLYAIQKLNPNIDFSYMNPNFGNSNSMFYLGDLDIKNLKLPDGFEYDEKSGITNKNKTNTGYFLSVNLEKTENKNILIDKNKLERQFKQSEDLKTIYPQIAKNSDLDHTKIQKYINTKFVKITREYPMIFTPDLLDKVLNAYENNPITFDEAKRNIDNSIKAKIISSKQDKSEEKHIDNSGVVRESQSFSHIQSVYDKVQNILKNGDSKLYLAGGSVPYFILEEDSHRKHDDIDTLADLSDMSELRTLFKEAGLYKAEWDSLNCVQDGNDYGFEMVIDGCPVGIYPFMYDEQNKKLTQYTFDPYLQHCKIKDVPVKELSEYVTNYDTKSGNKLNAQCLELIKKSKVNANRDKDIVDIKKIDETGLIRPEVYDRIKDGAYKQTQDESASYLNKNTSLSEATNNAINRLSYELMNKNNIQITNSDRSFLTKHCGEQISYQDVRKVLAEEKNYQINQNLSTSEDCN